MNQCIESNKCMITTQLRETNILCGEIRPLFMLMA